MTKKSLEQLEVFMPQEPQKNLAEYATPI